MNISINQTLHGYQNGHQLLANSTPLSSDLSKVLLFQSDLSGSLSNLSFESYITGYPVNTDNIYALARTWYAHEMKRPGCVWTHTLLIKFPDLGKIPDLLSLLSLFKRPTLNQFLEYNLALEIDFSTLVRGSEQISNDFIDEDLYLNTYFYADKSIIIPSASPKDHEEQIINLWSNQWPRLRRNFYFCSGALSLKMLSDRVFDIQVIPVEILKSFMRINPNLIQYSNFVNSENWLSTFKKSPKMSIRRFLWTFGSDIEGTRDNFIPLIQLYQSIYINKDLVEVVDLLKTFFYDAKEAKNLKSKIFGIESILIYPESEKQIVTYLLTADNINYLNSVDIDIERRLINILQNGEIQVHQLLDLVSISDPSRLTENFWNDLEIDEGNIVNLLFKNYEIAIPFVLKNQNIIFNLDVWRLPYEYQLNLFKIISDRGLISNWDKLTKTILETQSDIIFELFWKHGEDIASYSFDWYNQGKPNRSFSDKWKQFITQEKDYTFVNWLKKNERIIHSKTFSLIFDNLSSRKIISLNFNHNTWLSAYKKLKQIEYEGNIPYIASLLLTIGFNNDIAGADWLVSVTFQDVYNFAANLKIDNQLWNMIPKEYVDEPDEDEQGFIETILSILKAKPKKKSQVESWDYCENLVRTLCNKTVKYNWNPGAFLNTLKDQKTFYRAINYCLSIKRGHSFIVKILSHIENKQIQFEPFQYQYLRKIKRSK